MRFLTYGILLLITIYNVYLSSALVRNGEVNFFNDVARDFLLLQELDEKKIVLIGPRSSTNNLFHGPLLTYINYPSYLIGGGDPVIVAWFWVILGVVFLITSFFIVRKMFGIFPSLIFTSLISIKMAPHLNNVFEPEAMFFVMPIFLFTIMQYKKTGDLKYLIYHLVATSVMVQLSIGIGTQLLILSTIVIFYIFYRKRIWKHLFSFIIIPILTANYIAFDIRNDFRMAHALLSTGKAFEFFITFRSWVENRLNSMISLQLVESENNFFTLIIFVLVITFTIIQIKNKNKNQHIYKIFLFYYFGYFIMSFFNKGILLFHYIYLLMPLTILWLVAFLSSRYRLLFLPIIIFIYFTNLGNAQSYISSRLSAMGENYNSWKALSNVAKEITLLQEGKEFGYFVFAPDALAYQPRYAMMYNFKKSKAKASEYTKKPITYIIAAPPPSNDPYMDHIWWRKNPVKISSEPILTKTFPNGFTIEKFELSSEEQKITHDKNIELGIHFR